MSPLKQKKQRSDKEIVGNREREGQAGKLAAILTTSDSSSSEAQPKTGSFYNRRDTNAEQQTMLTWHGVYILR